MRQAILLRCNSLQMGLFPNMCWTWRSSDALLMPSDQTIKRSNAHFRGCMPSAGIPRCQPCSKSSQRCIICLTRGSPSHINRTSCLKEITHASIESRRTSSQEGCINSFYVCHRALRRCDQQALCPCSSRLRKMLRRGRMRSRWPVLPGLR